MSFTPSMLYRRQPFDWRVGGPQSKLGYFGEDKNHLPPPGIKQFHHQPAQSLTTILNQLSQMCAQYIKTK
jgi:hypothetical protein